MERRHDPATSIDAPGLLVAPYSAVAPYPAAAILTAWANALHHGTAPQNQHPRVINVDEPVLTAGADAPFWPQARLPLGTALRAVPESWWPARCCLPVPGDLGGLPAGVPRALSAGQAIVWTHSGESVVLSPMTMPGGDRMWVAERASTSAAALPDRREVKAAIMAALEQCVTLAESSLLPRRTMTAEAVATLAELPVPMPPGTDAATVALGRQSATLVAIVTTAMAALPETTEGAELRAALVPLGRAAREGLSVAFSASAGR